MTDAFSATFSDFRLVKGRKVAQIVLEVALEQADAALEVLGGVPRPDAERWVAVARMKPPAPTPKPKRERLTSERAAMLCNDAAFRGWFATAHARDAHPALDIVALIRAHLNVNSRAELDTDPEARKRFEALESEFNQSTGRMAHVR